MTLFLGGSPWNIITMLLFQFKLLSDQVVIVVQVPTHREKSYGEIHQKSTLTNVDFLELVGGGIMVD